MARSDWEFEIDGNQHQLCLKHGVFSGRRQVWLDGETIHASRNLVDYGSAHTFEVDGHQLDLEIITNGVTYQYYLAVDGKMVPSQRQAAARSKVKGLAKRQEAIDDWQELAKLTGLEFTPVRNGFLPWRNRLVGKIDEFLTSVYLIRSRSSTQPLLAILVRFNLKDPNEVREKLLTQSRLRLLFGHGKRKDVDLFLDKRMAILVMRYQPEQDGLERIAERITAFVRLLVDFAQPERVQSCEAPRCNTPDEKPLQWVLVSGMPLLHCPTCLASIPSTSRNLVSESYQNTPTRRLQGLVSGFGAAILAGVVFSAIMHLEIGLGAMGGPLAFLFILWAMDRVQTKRSVWTLLTADALAVLAVIISAYFYLLNGVIQAGTTPLSAVFGIAWDFLISDLRFLYASLIVTIFFVGLLNWGLITGLRGSLSRLSNPLIEEISLTEN